MILFPPFHLDPINEQLWRGTRRVALKPKTFAVLRYLLERPQRLITKEDLLDALWAEVHVGEAVLKTHIREIRQALGDTAKAPHFIETVHRRGYRFIAPVQDAPPSPHGPLPRPRSSPTSSFVGRHAELACLRGSLERARGGQRHVAFVTGEPGIGKTTLVKEFLEPLQGRGDLWVTWGQCIQQFGAGEAYLPLLEALGRLCRAPGAERVSEVLTRQAPTWLVQMPGLRSTTEPQALRREAGAEDQSRRPAGAAPERMLREMAEALEAVSEERLLVLWFEDLHWADYSTLDLISYLARRSGPARLLVLGTYRPVEVLLDKHPLGSVTHDLLLHGQCEEVSLTSLDERAVGEYLETRCPGHRFPPGLAPLIHRRTDGNPLFMTSVVDSLVKRGLVSRSEGRWQLTVGLEDVALGVPDNIVRMIERESDRLTSLERSVLEAASVAGMEFSAGAVAAAVEEDAIRVEEVCIQLARRGQFLHLKGRTCWPDGTVAVRCGFIHALYRDVAYERIGAMRRARMHQRIGERQEAGYGDRAAEIAAELAVHFEQGGDSRRAVRYLRSAGENALRRSANREAVAHLMRALSLLEGLPETPEVLAGAVETRIALAPALIALEGAGSAEVEASYLSARELVDRLGDASRLFPVLWGLWFVDYSRGRYEAARETGQRLLQAAQSGDDTGRLLEAHHALWPTLSAIGQPAAAGPHLVEGLALYNRTRHASAAFLYAGHDPGVCCRYYLALTRWLLGYPDRAVDALRDALRLVAELRHPLTTVNALWFDAWVHAQRGERDIAAVSADRVVALSAEHAFSGWTDAALPLTWLGGGTRPDTQALAGWHRRLVSAWTGGAVWRQVFCLCALAEIHAEEGRVEEARGALASIPEEVRGAFYAPEIHRIQGELLLQRPAPATDDAECHFRAAIDLARARDEKSLELRAATSLARLWRGQGERDDGRRLLAGIYGWFTEGFDTADLRAARELLEEMS